MRVTEKLSEEANRKWPIGNRKVTWPMTSRDTEMSRHSMLYSIAVPICNTGSQRVETKAWNNINIKECPKEWSTYKLGRHTAGNCYLNSDQIISLDAACELSHPAWSWMSSNDKTGVNETDKWGDDTQASFARGSHMPQVPVDVFSAAVNPLTPTVAVWVVGTPSNERQTERQSAGMSKITN